MRCLNRCLQYREGLDPVSALEMTGQSGTAIQNWVKRGWVANPVNKKYGGAAGGEGSDDQPAAADHAARQNRAAPAVYQRPCRGSSDDIIPEPQLYTLVSTAILKCREKGNMDRESLIALIGAQLEGYEGPVPDAKERLGKAMTMILLNAGRSAHAGGRQPVPVDDPGGKRTSTSA